MASKDINKMTREEIAELVKNSLPKKQNTPKTETTVNTNGGGKNSATDSVNTIGRNEAAKLVSDALANVRAQSSGRTYNPGGLNTQFKERQAQQQAEAANKRQRSEKEIKIEQKHNEEMIGLLKNAITQTEASRALADAASDATEYNRLAERRKQLTSQLSSQQAKKNALQAELNGAAKLAAETNKQAPDFAEKSKAGESKIASTADIDAAEKRVMQLRAQLTTAPGNQKNIYASQLALAMENLNKLEAKPRGESDETYDFVNDINGYREKTRRESRKGNYGEYQTLSFLTPEEVANYNYAYATRGKEAADDYLNALMDELRQREAGEIVKNTDTEIGKTLFGVGAGIDQYITSVKQQFTDEALPTSVVQYAGQKMRKDMGDIQGVVYDLLQTTANMAPSILLAGVTGGAAAAAGLPTAAVKAASVLPFGMSARGNALNEKLKEGADPQKAQVYATLVGIAEAGLQAMVGGIAKLGGVNTTKFANKIAAIDKTLWRVAGQFALSGAGEALEESAQSYLEPAIAALVFNEKYEAPDVEEALYSGLLGFLSAGLLEGGEIILGDAEARKAGANIKSLGKDAVQMMVDYGLSAQKDSVEYKIAENVKKKVENAKDVSAYELGKIYGEAMNELSFGDALGMNIKLESLRQTEGESKNERGVLPGESEGRQPGESAGQQNGGMAETAGAGRTADPRRRAVSARAITEVLRGTEKSAAEIGVKNGSTDKTMTFIPREKYNAEMNEVQQKVKRETGYDVEFYTGELRVKADNARGYRVANAAVFNGRMVVQADSETWLIEQLADHESMHTFIDSGISGKDKESLYNYLRNKTVDKYGREEFEKVLQTYVKNLRGTEATTVDKVTEELICDAYAGMNAFSSNVTQYTDTVKNGLSEFNAPKETQKTTEQTRGPPEDKRLAQLAEDLRSGKITEEEFDAQYDLISAEADMQDRENFSWAEPEKIEDADEKKKVIAQLKKYMDGNMSLQELRGYINGAADVKAQPAKTEGSEADEIIRSARTRNMSVRDYVNENWDRYERNGRPNEAAQEAMRRERGRFSMTEEDDNGQNSTARNSNAGIGNREKSNRPRTERSDVRSESTDEFYKRTADEGKFVQDFGRFKLGYRPVVSDYNAPAQSTIEELEKLGIFTIAIDGETEYHDSQENTTTVANTLAKTLFDGSVFVSNSIDEDIAGKETAGHEAFHSWELTKKPEAKRYLSEITKAINVDSETYKTIAEETLVHYNATETNDKDRLQRVLKEIAAFTSGELYSNKNKIDVEDIFTDTKAVKDAWLQMMNANDAGYVVTLDNEPKFSVTEDSDGNELTEGQQEHFARTKALDQDGNLEVVYHGTVSDFTIFSREFANPEGDMGAGFYFTNTEYDADTNYGDEEGPDLKVKIERLAERLQWEEDMEDYDEAEEEARRRLITAEPHTMKMYLNIENPVVLGGKDATFFDMYEEYDEEADEYGEPEGLLVDFIEALQEEVGEGDYSESTVDATALWEKGYDGLNAEELIKITKKEVLPYIEDENGNLCNGEVIRATFERMGFDGIIDHTVFNKFRNMEGMVSQTTHYIVFNSNQAKNVDNLNPTDNDDIRFSTTEAAAEENADTAIKLPSGARESLNSKAQDYLRGVERRVTAEIGKALSVPKYVQKNYLQNIVQQLTEEYLDNGTVSQTSINKLFEKAYEEGRVVEEEFFNAYKDVREMLKTSKVTISEYDRHDIPDWADFRKKTFGKLRIVNEGGSPVDTFYEEELRRIAPDLFPEDITAPSDQLMRMYDVANSLGRTEKTLDEYYGKDAKLFKDWARNDFENAVADMMSELNTLKRYADEKSRETVVAATDPETIKNAFSKIKEARKQRDKARAKNLLTSEDEMQLGRLLRGEILPEHLDGNKYNVKGIMAVYEASQEYEQLAKVLKEYKKGVKKQRLKKAESLLANIDKFKDKKMGLMYARETLERNFEDIAGADAEALKKEYAEPVHVHEKQSTELKNFYRNKVRKMNLSDKVQKGNLVSESHAVQLLGEAQDIIEVLEASKGRIKERDGKTLADWRGVVQNLYKENPNMDWQKVNKAIAEFKNIYDELFRMMNEVRIRNGYEPVNYRRGYFPHFQPGNTDGILSSFGKLLGVDVDVSALPTTITGLTHTFKPGITWFGNAQERLGFNTAYDAVAGFDKYVEGVADVIFHTDDIQNLRALATQIRYMSSDEAIKRRVDDIRNSNGYTEDEKAVLVDDLLSKGKYNLANFVVDLEEYTNLLANKKSRADRDIEQATNRAIYKLLKAWESRVAANMVAINPASWLTNFIPLTQGGAQLDKGALIKGMYDTLQAYIKDDGFVSRSVFLTNRRGSDPIVRSWADKASATLASPMELIDRFTADSLVRGRYAQNIRRGMSEAAAMTEADNWAAKVMADRSKGSTPTLFNRTNPLTKLFTQFQLEANNQLSYLFKDLPRNERERGKKALIKALLKFFVGAWLYNEVYEYFVGRRPALDVLGMINEGVGDVTGYQLPNLVEMGVSLAKGEEIDFETEKASRFEKGKNLVKNIAEEAPFVGGLVGGGRLPIQSALPDMEKLWKGISDEEMDAKKRLSTIGKEIAKPAAYWVLPFGGGQIKKVLEAVNVILEGGSYTINSEGEKVLQYPVYTDTIADMVKSIAGAALFGKTALEPGRKWVDRDFKNFTVKETAAYEGLTQAGVNDRDAIEFIKKLRNGTVHINMDNSDISAEGKAIAFYSLFATNKEKNILDEIANMGGDFSGAGDTIMRLSDLAAGTAKTEDLRAMLNEAELGETEKGIIYRDLYASEEEQLVLEEMADSDFGEISAAMRDMKEISKEKEKLSYISGTGFTADEKEQLAAMVVGTRETDRSGNLTSEYKMVDSEGKPTAYANMQKVLKTGASIDQYIKLREYGIQTDDYLSQIEDGLSVKDAISLLTGKKDNPPENGKTRTDAETYKIILDSGLSDSGQEIALRDVLGKSAYKADVADDYGISAEEFMEFKIILPGYDADENKQYKQSEVEAALDSMSNLSTAEKAALWQIQTGATSAKNNPYSVSVGKKVLAALKENK